MLQYTINVDNCNQKKKISQTEYSYCLNSYGSSFKNIVIKNQQKDTEEAQSITVQSIFLTLPQVSDLNVTINAKVEAEKFMIVHFINQDIVQPINITYILDSDSTILKLYGLTSKLYKVSLIEALQLNFESINENADISFLCETSTPQSFIQQSSDDQSTIQQEPLLTIRKLLIQSGSGNVVKSYNLQNALTNNIAIDQYIYKAQFAIKNPSYFLCENLDYEVKISNLVAQGKVTINYEQETQNYLAYGNSESNINKLNVQQVSKGIQSTIQYIYGSEETIEPDKSSITFEINEFNNNIDDQYAYYIAYNSKDHNDKKILIKAPQPSTTNADQKVAVFGNAEGSMQNIKITFDTGFNVSCAKIFGLIYSPSNELSMNNVTVNMGTQELNHENTEIYGFIANISNQNVQLSDCYFYGQIQSTVAGMFGNVSSNSNITIDKLEINSILTVQKGAFIFFYSNDSNIEIKNTNIIGDTTNGDNTIAGSKITGDMVASIGYVFNKGQLTMNDVTIKGCVDAQTYKSAGIINLYYNEGSEISATSVEFAPGTGHENYYSCFTSNLDIQKPEGITCPDDDNRTKYEITDFVSSGKFIEQSTTTKLGTENVDHQYYLINSNNNYNNSDITIQDSIIEPKSDKQLTLVLSLFSQSLSEQMSKWINIQINQEITSTTLSHTCKFYISGMINSQVQNLQFFNCQNNLQFTSLYSRNAATQGKYSYEYISGFISYQSQQFTTQFINCSSQINHKYTTNSSQTYQGYVTLNNYIYNSLGSNNYIKCNNTIIDNDQTKKLSSISYQSQNLENCKKFQSLIQGENDTDETKCKVDTNLKWW